MNSIGFIGAGNMGGALARAVRRQLPDAEMIISNRRREKAEVLANEIGGRAGSNEDVARECGVVFLGVKPNIVPAVLEELAPVWAERKDPPVLVSMAAGISLSELEKLAPGLPVVRIMPNTPVSIGCGVTLYTCGSRVGEQARELVLALLKSSGSMVEIPEIQMDAAGKVAGCGPAFVDLFLEALADGGVFCGLPRDLALRLAAEMTAGAARLALESGRHPGALKDAVCSPGGTTIRGVRRLEQGAFRSTVMEAVISAGKKDGQ